MLYLLSYSRTERIMKVERVHYRIAKAGLLIDYFELVGILDCLTKRTRKEIVKSLKERDKVEVPINNHELIILETLFYFAK